MGVAPLFVTPAAPKLPASQPRVPPGECPFPLLPSSQYSFLPLHYTPHFFRFPLAPFLYGPLSFLAPSSAYSPLSPFISLSIPISLFPPSYLFLGIPPSRPILLYSLPYSFFISGSLPLGSFLSVFLPSSFAFNSPPVFPIRPFSTFLTSFPSSLPHKSPLFLHLFILCLLLLFLIPSFSHSFFTFPVSFRFLRPPCLCISHFFFPSFLPDNFPFLSFFIFCLFLHFLLPSFLHVFILQSHASLLLYYYCLPLLPLLSTSLSLPLVSSPFSLFHSFHSIFLSVSPFRSSIFFIYI